MYNLIYYVNIESILAQNQEIIYIKLIFAFKFSVSICIILLDGKCTPNTRNKMANLIIIIHDLKSLIMYII